MEISLISFRVLHRYTHSAKLPHTHHWCLEGKRLPFHTLSSGFSVLPSPVLKEWLFFKQRRSLASTAQPSCQTLTDWKATNLQWTNNRVLWPLAPLTVSDPIPLSLSLLVLDVLPMAPSKIWCHLNMFLKKLIS